MKIKRRTLAILLTLAMTLTLVPTVVFAGEKKDADPKKQQQRDAEIGANSLVAQRNMGWSIRGAERLDLDEDNSFYLWVNNTSGETVPSLQYRLVYDDTKEEIRNWTDMNEVDEDGDPYVIIQTTEIGVGDFTFEVREKSNTGNKQTCSITVYSYDWKLMNAGESSLELGSDEYCYFWIESQSGSTLPEMEYRIVCDDDIGEEIIGWTDMDEIDEDGDPHVIVNASDVGLGDYIFEAREKNNQENYASYYFDVYKAPSYFTVYVGGLKYELNTEKEADLAGLWGYTDEFNGDSITVLSQVRLSNGKTYAVTEIQDMYGLSNLKSISIPASVGKIEEMSIGYYGYDDDYNKTYQKVPNFTIYGKIGSAAHQYASENVFSFRDLEAEAAAAAAARTAASNINKATVTAADVQNAASTGATSVVLGPSVKKVSKNAFKGTNIKTIVVKTKKLKAKSVKGSLKGSKVKTVKVEIGSKKVNKKFVKKYKKFFTKKNAGKKAKVK